MFPLDTFRATLDKAIRLFQQHGIRFHLTGGIASVYYGEPRMTQDIDIVIDNAQVAAALDWFLVSIDESDFIFDGDSVRRAVADGGMFQLLDGVESLKLDIYPRELIPGELDRSVLRKVFEDQALPLASCADVGASKLVWISKGSHKSRRDLRQLFRLASAADRSSIERLAEQLDLAPLLAEVLGESDEIS
jgi:hypothetical protein